MRIDDFIRTAESFIGVREDPPGSNRTPIGVEYGWNGVAWCAEDVSVCCQRNGFPLKTAAVIEIERHAKAGDWGMTWSATPVRGSAVCFDWEGRGNPADMHVGIVTDVLDGGRFRTIEGNYRDRCDRVLRDMTYVRGFAVFPFDDASAAPATPAPAQAPAQQAPSGPPLLRNGSTGGSVQLVQTIIRDHAGGNIGVDGQFGPQTEARVKDVQRAFGLQDDGVVGPQTWAVIQRLAAGEPFPAPAAPPQPAPAPAPKPFGDWPETSKALIRRGSRGGEVSYLQQVISAKAGGHIGIDGNFGPQTESRVRTVQLNNGIGVDGIVGPQTWGVIDRLARS